MASLYERHAFFEFPQPVTRNLECPWIAIDRDKPCRRITRQQGFRVPAQPDRRIDQCSIRAIRSEEFDDLF